jgi:hypothetical protein
VAWGARSRVLRGVARIGAAIGMVRTAFRTHLGRRRRRSPRARCCSRGQFIAGLHSRVSRCARDTRVPAPQRRQLNGDEQRSGNRENVADGEHVERPFSRSCGPDAGLNALRLEARTFLGPPKSDNPPNRVGRPRTGRCGPAVPAVPHRGPVLFVRHQRRDMSSRVWAVGFDGTHRRLYRRSATTRQCSRPRDGFPPS